MQGKVVYTSPTGTDPQYVLIDFDNGDLYAVQVKLPKEEVDDPTVPIISDVFALFALTADEFCLKDTHTQALDAIVLKLRRERPKDRLMQACCRSNPDNIETPLQLKPGCPTVDNGKFKKYQLRAYALKFGIPFLNKAEKIYMIYNTNISESIPACTWDGCANIFTSREYAEAFVNGSELPTLAIREFTKAEFDAHIKTWYAYGILNFRLNVGTKDHACVILRDDYSPDPNAKFFEYSGSSLCSLIWKYINTSASNNENMAAMAQTSFGLLCHELKQTFFLCPFAYAEEKYPLDKPDREIRVSQRCAELKCTVDEKQIPLFRPDIKFFGGEAYRFAQKPSFDKSRAMKLITLKHPTGLFLPAYTDLAALTRVCGDKIRIGMFSYDELRTFAERNEDLTGILINPGSMTLPIFKKDMDTVEKISSEQVKIYVPKSKKPSDEAASDTPTNDPSVPTAAATASDESADAAETASPTAKAENAASDEASEVSHEPAASADAETGADTASEKSGGIFGRIKNMFK